MHHETVNQFIYDDTAVGGYLYQHLRIVFKPYRKYYGHYDRWGKFKNRVSIDERPSIVGKRSRICDWEADMALRFDA